MAVLRSRISALIATLNSEQLHEQDARKLCDRETAQMATSREERAREEETVSATEARLGVQIDEIDAGVARANSSAGEVAHDLEVAERQRDEERELFLNETRKQEANREALRSALETLREHYRKAGAAALAQRGSAGAAAAPERSPPPVGATGKDAVLATLEWLIEDVGHLIQQLKEAESRAQAAYETLLQDSTVVVQAKKEELTALAYQRGQANEARVARQRQLEGLRDAKKAADKLEAALHEKCDSLARDFAENQKSRQEEVENLHRAELLFGGGQAAAGLLATGQRPSLRAAARHGP